ncbi:MAG: glycoside hydrolase family 5 protein [Candidatus Sumerlaeia bacterium]|nr:glycoside hydrolase family 5 protein [Candidatus Sumerlaeia bacterium]
MKIKQKTTRREWMGGIGGAIAAAALVNLSRTVSGAESSPAIPKNPLPRWRGANLLEKFSAGSKGDKPNQPFVERDFEWLVRWKMDFVRLPMDYRFWCQMPDRRAFKESALKEIDQAVEWGRQYNVHVSINFHRAPGYCINNPELEPFNLWTDAEAQDICELHWRMFAKRYKGIPSSRLSFNLWNEPPRPGSGGMTRENHEKVARRMVKAIREEDPDRMIIADGLSVANDPIPELDDLKLPLSLHTYQPFQLTHYRASWAKGSDKWPEPTWPLKQGNTLWDRDYLYNRYRPWLEPMRKGIGVHCGETGVYNRTPHKVVLAFQRDLFSMLKDYGIGWAMWNLRGSFGWIDSGRKDVKYENFEGHQLDREMLELLLTM